MFINPSLFFSIAIFSILFYLRIVLPPSHFADYLSYEEIITNAPNVFDNSLYEWLSYATFSAIGVLRDFGLDAVYWMYIYNFFFIATLFLVVFKVSNKGIAGVLLVISLYAPLFSFVILRAAPAYLIIALALFYVALNKRKASSLFAVIATLYHVSAVIPAIIIIMLNIYGDRILRYSNYIFFASVIIGVFQIINFWIGANMIPINLQEIILGYESIEKYSTYLDSPMESSTFHRVYFCASFLMVLLAKYKYLSIDRNLSLYFYILFGLHAIMMVSPVTAYRISIFYMLPLLLVFPWGSLGHGIFKYFIYLCYSIVLYFSFLGVMA